jgi:hypothetical protein
MVSDGVSATSSRITSCRSLAAAATASLRAGDVIFGVGSHEGTPLAAFGIVALASGAWRSSRGGRTEAVFKAAHLGNVML